MNKLLLFRISITLQQCLINLLIIAVANSLTSFASMVEDISLPTVKIIERNGYPVEIHSVTTSDGYVLEMHRIPKSKNGRLPTKNYPVFFHHGILGSSVDWVIGGPNSSLAMQLSDSGYDIWLANCRGNVYSTKHVSLSVKSKAYWNFSIHELGVHDLPASIDYILTSARVQQLHYVGYSMGTTVFYIMASERPEYQAKIRSQISMAPVAYLSNTRSPLKYLIPYSKTLNTMFQTLAAGKLMTHSKAKTFMARFVCGPRITQKLVCQKYIMFTFCGSDPYDFDTRLVPYIFGHLPAGTSAKAVVHFAQMSIAGEFKQYDYGPSANTLLYNSSAPPDYDLRSIRVPVSLIYGDNDLIADTKDVMKLKDRLPAVLDVVRVDNEYCNHLDFLWSKSVTKLVNNPIRGILDKTDELSWRYEGADRVIETPSTTVGQNPVGARTAFFADGNLGLDYLAANLDAIVDNAAPRKWRSAADAQQFRRQKRVQKLVFGNLIRFARRFEKRNVVRPRDSVFVDNALLAIGRVTVVENAAGTEGSTKSEALTKVQETTSDVSTGPSGGIESLTETEDPTKVEKLTKTEETANDGLVGPNDGIDGLASPTSRRR